MNCLYYLVVVMSCEVVKYTHHIVHQHTKYVDCPKKNWLLAFRNGLYLETFLLKRLFIKIKDQVSIIFIKFAFYGVHVHCTEGLTETETNRNYDDVVVSMVNLKIDIIFKTIFYQSCWPRSEIMLCSRKAWQTSFAVGLESEVWRVWE